jgi:arsenate reductase
MAEGILQSLDANNRVASAGTNPAPAVHPKAVEVMSEIGIDISDGFPKDVDQFLDEEFDFVITVCDNARESCPVFSGSVGSNLHIGFEDPAEARGSEGEVLAVFREVRDQIRQRFQEFYNQNLRS